MHAQVQQYIHTYTHISSITLRREMTVLVLKSIFFNKLILKENIFID